jgi:hypothetical protein
MSSRRVFVPSSLTDLRSPSGSANSPLLYWRTLPAQAFDDAARITLRLALLQAPPPDHPDWAAACQADPDACLHVACTVRADWLDNSQHVDLVLSAVALCAALGDLRCRRVLAHLLSRRASNRADLEVLRLAHSWRRSFDPKAGMSAGRRF